MSRLLREFITQTARQEAVWLGTGQVDNAYDVKGATNARAGCHDDRVMALALALYGLAERPHETRKFKAIPARELYKANDTTGY